jgi:glycosyltransferase involved in cell wall biosynthesis
MVFEKQRIVRKNILIVHNDSWSAYNHRIDFIKYLINQGFNIKVAASNVGHYNTLIEKVCPFIELKYLKPKGKNIFTNIFLLFSLYKVYKKESPDFILHFTAKPNIFGGIAAGLLKIPCIATVNGLGRIFSKKNIFTSIVKILYKTGFKKTSKVFFQNKDDQHLFITNKIVPLGKTIVINGSGINLDKFKSKGYEANPENTIFFLGSRIIAEKGIYEYAAAAKIIKEKYPTVIFRLAGHFEEKDPLSVKKYDFDLWQKENWIEYIGMTDDIKTEIDKTHLVILPSYYREGIPKILLEATAMAKPIITTNNVGCKEAVVGGYNGYMVEVKNVESLVIAIERFLLSTISQKKTMSDNSRKMAEEKFDETKIYQTYSRSINELDKR